MWTYWTPSTEMILTSLEEELYQSVGWRINGHTPQLFLGSFDFALDCVDGYWRGSLLVVLNPLFTKVHIRKLRASYDFLRYCSSKAKGKVSKR